MFLSVFFKLLFQLCIDDFAVYHGHYLGVSKYSLTNGHLIWIVGSEWKAAVLAGSQVLVTLVLFLPGTFFIPFIEQ